METFSLKKLSYQQIFYSAGNWNSAPQNEARHEINTLKIMLNADYLVYLHCEKHITSTP